MADFAPPGMALDEFVVDKGSQELQRGSNFARSRAMIEGFIGQYYYYGLRGNMERAEGHLLLARKLHGECQALLAAQGERLALPAFIEGLHWLQMALNDWPSPGHPVAKE